MKAALIATRSVLVVDVGMAVGAAVTSGAGAVVGVNVSVETLARFQPVRFDRGLADAIEAVAKGRGLSTLRMTSGAGHDAQMLARVCRTAMIFVPSREGVSHNPAEFTPSEQLVQGAKVLLDVALQRLGRS